MKTSYFGNIRNVENPLSISLKAPDWYKGPEYKILAPKYDFLMRYKAGFINAATYTDLYYEKVLSQLNPSNVWQDIVEKYGEDVTLLCYELPDEFCHRHIVARWFGNSLGKSVTEINCTKTR